MEVGKSPYGSLPPPTDTLVSHKNVVTSPAAQIGAAGSSLDLLQNLPEYAADTVRDSSDGNGITKSPGGDTFLTMHGIYCHITQPRTSMDTEDWKGREIS